MDLGLQDKRFLVSGSTRGIGYAIAEMLTENLAQVVVTSRSAADVQAVSTKLPGSLGVPCDFTKPAEIAALRKEIHARWGSGLDGVVLNVGSGTSVADPIPDPAHFFEVMQRNFHAAVYAAHEFLEDVIARKGTLVLISSIAGLEAIGAPTDYSVAKAALNSLSKNLARKLGSQGVRVNTIAPGNILFPGGSWASKLEKNPEQVNSYISQNVPLKRFGKPHEIAAACAFLCSMHAEFITGATLVIDGGQTVGSHG